MKAKEEKKDKEKKDAMWTETKGRAGALSERHGSWMGTPAMYFWGRCWSRSCPAKLRGRGKQKRKEMRKRDKECPYLNATISHIICRQKQAPYTGGTINSISESPYLLKSQAIPRTALKTQSAT
jgi:hypothetical protein